MRRLIFIAAVSTLLGACAKDIDFNQKDIKPQLIVNSQMTVGDTLHLVYLAVSKSDRIEKIKSGYVKCYVNGEYVADGQLDNRDDDLFIKEDLHLYGRYYSDFYNKEMYTAGPNAASKNNQTRYSFKADFKPGDVVRIEAEAEADGETFKAYSEVVIPKAPEFSITDTLSQKNQYGDHVYRIRVKGKDIIGEDNFYRILSGRSVIDKKIRYASEREEAKTWEETRNYSFIRLDKGNDPILNDGAPAEDLDLEGASENTFRVFSDRQFSDGTFNIGFNVNANEILYGLHGVLNYNRMESETTLSVTIRGITKEEYYYLKALSIYDYLDGDTTLTEPVSFPDNVEGGVGLVSISSESVASIKFKRTYDVDSSWVYTDD